MLTNAKLFCVVVVFNLVTHTVLPQNQVDKHPTLYCLDELGYSPRQSQSMRLMDRNDVGGSCSSKNQKDERHAQYFYLK